MITSCLRIAFFLSVSSTALYAAGQTRPNVLLVIVDDMNDWVGCLNGHPDVKTPNMDRLAARGLLFTNAHCPAPVCNPSRVATLTGRRPSSTGVYDNGAVWHAALPDIATIPQHFKANGYYVAGGGKVYHHMPGFNRKSDWNYYFNQIFSGHYQDQLARGLDVSNFQWPNGFPLNQLPEVKSFSKPPVNAREFDWGPFELPDREMGDGQMVEWAVKFLEDPPRQPFLLATGIFRPHLPFYAPQKYFDMYSPQQITPPPINADDLDDLPEGGQKMAASRRGDYELIVRAGKYQELLEAYLANITFADALIGRLLDALDASPAANNTIIALWSDHGWHFGEKQALHKFTLWERSTRIPFLVAAPGVTDLSSQSSRPVGLVDLFPTLNELCSLPPVSELDGTSLVPLLRNPQSERDRPAITTHGRGNHAVRSEHWRYIRYADGGEELYDHQRDPHEWTNLAAEPEQARIKNELAAWLPKKDAEPLKRKKSR